VGRLELKSERPSNRMEDSPPKENRKMSSLESTAHETCLRTLEPGEDAHATTEDLLARAKSLAFGRPLVAYPGRTFSADWDNPDLAFRMRRRIWECFNQRRLEIPLGRRPLWPCPAISSRPPGLSIQMAEQPSILTGRPLAALRFCSFAQPIAESGAFSAHGMLGIKCSVSAVSITHGPWQRPVGNGC
jgi:hypothetical protein